MESKTIRLGLHLPLFAASLITLFVGAPVLGLIGIWAFAVPGEPVPHFLKISHAHLAWWSVILLVSSLIVPALRLSARFRRWLTFGALAALPIYAGLIAAHYNIQAAKVNIWPFGELYLSVYGALAFILEIAFFGMAVVLALLAAGEKIPGIKQENGDEDTAYSLMSNISIPRKVFGVYAVFLTMSVTIGLWILAFFTLPRIPVQPAALTQMHTHLGIFAVGFVMVMIALRAIGVGKKTEKALYVTGVLALAGTAVGFIFFLLGLADSWSWVLPAMLQVVLLFGGWIALFKVFGVRKTADRYFHYVRWTLIVIWGALLAYTLMGPYIALKYTKTPDVTVTYKQVDGGEYGNHVGPYPEYKDNYLGTAPDEGNPRGLENFHLSPGSWSHVAIFWLLILMVFGKQIFPRIGAPNLLFSTAVLIAAAPIANSIGRLGAWTGVKGGKGPLILVGHPLKTINIITLFTITVLLIRKIKSGKSANTANGDKT